jgi:hypothetical protein
MVSKYDGLGTYLRSQTGDRIAMTFEEIEHVTGTRLPEKSQHSRAWWSNNASNSVLTKVWLDAGFESAEVDLRGRKLVFVRTRPTGMAEEGREFRAEEPSKEKKPHRSPLWGALKGTFWIDPEWDLTKPALSDEEMAEWETSLERKADLIFGKKKP